MQNIISASVIRKRYLLIIAGVFFFSGLNAQVSVFDCGMYHQDLSPSQVNSQQTINGSCMTLGANGAIQVNNSTSKSVFASQGITLKNDVHIGAFDSDGGVHLKITGKAGLEVVVMNYTDLYGVLRYKKAEFGIRIPDDILTRIGHFLNEEGVHQDELNPFLEWNIDVEATFIHPASGTVRKVDGYYTREYSENSQTDDWDDGGTDYPFRVRFAPPLNGDWLAEISIRIDNEQQSAYTSDLFGFNVVESGDPGYVKVHENGRNLKRGDKMMIATGMNFVSPDDHSMAWGGGGDDNYIGNKLFGAGNTEKACNTKEWTYFRQKVEQFFQAGGKYIKTMQFPWSSLIEFEKKGNYYKRLHYVWEQDKLLDLCEQYDALMLFDLMYQVPLEKCSGYGMYYWDWDNYLKQGKETHPSHLPDINGPSGWYYDYPPYCYNDNPSWRSGSTVHEGKNPYEMFTNESDLNYHKQRTRYYVARYGYSTKIFEFEMLSEPWSLNNAEWAAPYDSVTHPEHASTRNAVKNYHQVISEYLKDTLKVNQLVGIDIHYWNDKPLDQLEESIELSKIDIVGTNPYYAAPNAAFSFYDYVQKIQERRGSTIPVILAEGGVDEEYTACSGHSQHPVDMMTFPFTGVAGYFTWFGMQEGLEHLWTATIRAQQHMDSEQVIETLSEGGGNWGVGRQESTLKKAKFGNTKTLVENQYYGGYNANTAVGYVKNRTYNIHTNGCYDFLFSTPPDFYLHHFTTISDNDVKITEKIKIISLQNLTHYYVDWYSFKDGNYLKTDYVKTNFIGTLKLDFPTLSDENPVLWYVVHKNAYSGMMQNETPLVAEDQLSSDFQFIELDTAVNTFTNAIYPNPFHNIITVNSLEDDEFIITTPTGSIIMQQNVHKGTNNIYIKELPKGLYFGGLRNQRFIIKLERL